jgi:adenylate cyclase
LSFNDMGAGLKERDFISNTFGRYVDREIARELLSRPEPMVRQATRCALKMQAAVKAENLAEPGLPPLSIGIGLHAGEVVVGNIGSANRAKYGIIGAAVNLTHRIQGQAKGDEVVVSGIVFRYSETTLGISRTFRTTLKGVARPTTL